jgi:hypothetical protein
LSLLAIWALGLVALIGLGFGLILVLLKWVQVQYRFRMGFPGEWMYEVAFSAPYFKRTWAGSGTPQAWFEKLLDGLQETPSSSRSHSESKIILPIPESGQAGFIRFPQFHWDANRAKKAGFLFFTHSQFWRPLLAYGRGEVGSFLWLLNLRFEASLGHPDPLRLSKAAGFHAVWNGALPRFSFPLELRFQDRRSTGHLAGAGKTSALRLVGFLWMAFWRIPLIRWGFLGFRCWRKPQLHGWRGWVYGKIQSL